MKNRALAWWLTVVFAGVAVLAGTFAIGRDTVAFAQSRKGPPSKIAAVISDRIAQLESARARGIAMAQAAQELSDRLLRVTAAGEFEVEFHARSRVNNGHADALRGFGAAILHSTADVVWPAGGVPAADLGIVAVRIPAERIPAAAALPWVTAVRPAERNPPDAGTFQSEGTALHDSIGANNLGFTGAGVTVGVVSNGVESLADALALGDLPYDQLTVLEEGDGDEGTAMLEIIHDVAPGASLLFHATGGGVAAHIDALNNLAAAGAHVVAEDIAFDAEPAFQKGATVVAAEGLALAGVSIHSSAGNLGSRHAERVRAIATHGGPDGNAGPFNGCAAGGPTNTVAIAGMTDTTFDVSVDPGDTISVTLQWSEPRAIFPTPGLGGFTDLDLYVMDAAGTTCLAQSTGGQGSGEGDTIEQASWTNGGSNAVTVKLVVNVFDDSTAINAPFLDLRWRGATALDFETRAGSLNPDSNYTFGATSAGAANTSVSTNPATVGIEGFSAGGPVRLVTTTVCAQGDAPPCTGVAGSLGQTVGGPTWTAADGVSVSGAGGFGSGNCPAVSQGSCRFFGTSAAAPHAAGIAALVREALGGSPTIFEIHQRMASTATNRDAPGFDNVWGFGILNARAAVSPPEADLSITKSDSPDPVVAGELLTYTLTSRNLGSSAAVAVVARDWSPAGVTIDSVTASGPSSCNAGVPGDPLRPSICTFDTLASGASATMTVVVRVLPGTTGLLQNDARVSSDLPDPDNSNNLATTATTVTSQADLSIQKADSPDPVLAGRILTYSLRVVNNGPSTAAGVAVEDVLPGEVDFVSATIASAAGTCVLVEVPPAPSAKKVVCGLGSMAPNTDAPAFVYIETRVKSGTPDGANIANTATVTSSTTDSVAGNNSAAASTTVQNRADLAVVKTAAADIYKPSSTIVYTVTVTQNGPSDALNVVVTDTLPTSNKAEYLFDTAGCSLTAGVLTCNLGTMTAGSVRSFNVHVRAKGSAGQVSNRASVTSDTFDPNAANNSSTKVVLVKGGT
jgi:uncharacterized repeat protein (TIGR01451 family)